MGNGVVLERGKHDELLSDEDGAYARLVAAQRLREAREAIDIADVPVGQSSEKAVESNADIEKAALEEIPLGRSNTHKSLASEILEQRNAEGLSKHEKEYSMFYLFRRMGRINKGEWKNYLFGCLFAIGKYFPCSDIWVFHHRFAATGSVFPAFGIVWGTSNVSSVSAWVWS
jgi:ATP-binding cassette subfamily B (MDR/TAP) protein 1